MYIDIDHHMGKLFDFVTPDFEREKDNERDRETIYLTTQYAQLHIKRA